MLTARNGCPPTCFRRSAITSAPTRTNVWIDPGPSTPIGCTDIAQANVRVGQRKQASKREANGATAAMHGSMNLIDGKAIAARINEETRECVVRMKRHGVTPGLAVVLV